MHKILPFSAEKPRNENFTQSCISQHTLHILFFSLEKMRTRSIIIPAIATVIIIRLKGKGQIR